jgi:hypothetical protein
VLAPLGSQQQLSMVKFRLVDSFDSNMTGLYFLKLLFNRILDS